MHVFENRYDRHENSNFYKRAIDTRKKKVRMNKPKKNIQNSQKEINHFTKYQKPMMGFY